MNNLGSRNPWLSSWERPRARPWRFHYAYNEANTSTAVEYFEQSSKIREDKLRDDLQTKTFATGFSQWLFARVESWFNLKFFISNSAGLGICMRDVRSCIGGLIDYFLKKTVNGPIYAGFDVTYGCNLDCKYCLNNSFEKSAGELDTVGALRLIDGLAATNLRFLSFNGGEPLLRADLPLLVAHAKRKDIHVNVNTNGLLFKKFARALCLAGLEMITISAHDCRAFGPMFLRIRKALEACGSDGLNLPKIRVRLLVTCENLNDVESLTNFLKSQGDIAILLQPIHLMQTRAPSQGVESQSAFSSFKRRWDVFLKRFPEFSSKYYRLFPEFLFGKLDGANIPCAAGSLFVHIDPCGNLYSCLEKKAFFGNILKTDFFASFKSASADEFRLKTRNASKCICWYNCSGPINCLLPATRR